MSYSAQNNVTQIRPNLRAGEQRVANTDDGFTRLANELYEELIGANLTRNQAKVAHAVCRKTYGFNKTMDRIADSQIAKLTRLPRQKVNTVKNELIAMGVLLAEGRLIGPNKNLNEWKIPGTKQGPFCHYNSDSHHNSDTVPMTVTNNVTKIVTALSPQQGHTKDTITKNSKDNINNPPKSPKSPVNQFDPVAIKLPEWLSAETWASWVEYRKDLKKPIRSSLTVTQALNLLDRSRAKGATPEEIINQSIANGWQGLFEPKTPAQPASTRPQEQFATKNYGQSEIPSWMEG